MCLSGRLFASVPGGIGFCAVANSRRRSNWEYVAGIQWYPPQKESILTHHIFRPAIPSDMLDYFVNNMFVVVRLRRISTSWELFSQDNVFDNIDMVALVEARCSGGTVNADRFLCAIFEYCNGAVTYCNNFIRT